MVTYTLWTNACPQIYHCLVENALYGYINIARDPSVIATDSSNSYNKATGVPKLTDVFTEEDPDISQKPFVLDRRSYIDNMFISATSRSLFDDKMNRLLKAFDKWNLSISLAISLWGRRKVDYLGHQISLAGLQAHLDLGSFVNIPFPRMCR